MRCSDATIQGILNKRASWILSKIKLLENRGKQLEDIQYKTGERLKLLGEYYDLNIVEGDFKECTAVFEQGRFNVYVDNGIEMDDRKLLIKNLLIKAYREIAKKILKERTDYFSNILEVKVNRIVIKEQKSRWGSCSSKSNINYNWRIIMAPRDVVDYLIVHELCHLKELNHSKAFWKEVENLLPGYELSEVWLKANGAALSNYFL